MVPGSLAIIAKAYPREERGRAIGIWAAASSLTTIAGPIIGGFMLTALGDWSWRLVFAINLPLGVVALALLWFRVAPDRPEAGRRLDVVGAVLATLALMLIAYGLTGDGSESVPPLSHTLPGAALGLVLAAGSSSSGKRAAAPMLPLRLFAQYRLFRRQRADLRAVFRPGRHHVLPAHDDDRRLGRNAGHGVARAVAAGDRC